MKAKSFRWRSRFVAALVVPAVVSPVAVAALPIAHAEASSDCPSLFVLAIQGTGESSEDASPTTDSGMLAQVMRPLLSMAGSMVQRAYVPYPAGFGGAVPGAKVPFEVSAQKAVDRATAMTKQIAGRCPDTAFAYTGYSQGAYAASILLKDIGFGRGPIPAEKVAGASLFGDPTRPAGSGLFPGKDGATTPDPAPGTDGAAVEALAPREVPTATGGGIGPTKESTTTFGDLDGRVASSCEGGDLACDAPSDAPITHIVANIAGSSTLDQSDPVQSLSSIAEALAATTVKSAIPVINEDFTGETLEDLSYQPQVSVSKRIETASDPRTAMPTVEDGIKALMKVGTIGLNAVVSVAKEVLQPQTLVELGTVGLANPVAALGVLGSKTLAATVKLVPPTTVSRWTQEAFTAVKENVSDNSELLDVANLTRYWQAAQQHGSYAQPTVTGGISAAAWTAAWFASLAADLAGKHDFRPTDENGVPTADPDVKNFPVPTLPSSTTAVSSISSSTPAAPSEEVPPWATGTVTISDTPVSSSATSSAPSSSTSSTPAAPTPSQ